MTNEQREAIENLSEINNLSKEELQNENITAILDYEDLKSLDTVLSLIKEQQGEIEGLKNKEVLIKRYFKKCDLIKQLTKQIDLMAEYWNTGLAMCDNCDRIVEKYEKNNCKDCIKQYFAGLVEKE